MSKENEELAIEGSSSETSQSVTQKETQKKKKRTKNEAATKKPLDDKPSW